MVQEDLFIAALQNKETQNRAFQQLVSQYKERLYWHIRRIVLDHDDADDVLQNTFLKIYRNIDSFKGESALFSWMYRIATNESLSFLKQKARKANITDKEMQESKIQNLQADVYFEGSDIQLKLQAAIAKLPEKQRLVFNMKYFEELKYEEMSQILDTSVGALKSSYHHAVKKLEEYLTKD
ncbi:DNA-directed RNA polymerase sigma-70 factor [Neptunitalea chrysea]|uniref:DNA-directed RNA polymerase sigma-70 factor n=1 Tax=Neptunitalea chrysea TaxID=1647581 RepID=A0A9W6EU86_9FLAO|nr:RNA polymerase sigma factor [Neptunitalea chrysea]GLB52294.1 DNA-directed RNA polymerase sigma-70 factor [Neptunitalea chrysea]